MPTYNGWNVVTWPTYPPAPKDIEFTLFRATALSRSPFTGAQQVQDWGGAWMEAAVSIPSLKASDGEIWVAFLRSLKGQACVFQFPSVVAAAFPASISDGTSPPSQRYWRLKGNSVKYGISLGKIYGISFEIMEAI